MAPTERRNDGKAEAAYMWSLVGTVKLPKKSL
jgi:hypothetical protein